MEFTNNRLISELFGMDDQNLHRLETLLNIKTSARGGVLAITGKDPEIAVAKQILETLYQRLKKGKIVLASEIDTAVASRHAAQSAAEISSSATSWQPRELLLTTRKRPIAPRTRTQVAYMQALAQHEVVFAAGPAGTGKTYIAVAQAVALWLQGRVERIVLSRPIVEAGEKLGFLPGDLKEKVDPYLRPLYDALYDMLPTDHLDKAFAQGAIEIAPIAFMRGRTLRDAFIIIDEAQNTTISQMKMLLTRLGENSRMVITGDPTQSDLPTHTASGLQDALTRLSHIKEIGFIAFQEHDIIRHPLTKHIVKAYAHA
jgi:phosphate starvation-inducible PhoH-like protein